MAAAVVQGQACHKACLTVSASARALFGRFGFRTEWGTRADAPAPCAHMNVHSS